MTAIHWNAAQTMGRTEAGHRVYILSNPDTKTRVVQVIPPPGGKHTELVVACEDPAALGSEAERLVEMCG